LSLDEVVSEEREALKLDERPPVGLALSGGGIRSATFSLGVLQALAESRRLNAFDYLSTVSGGGYIGSWLTAWIHREGLAAVQAKLGGLHGHASSTAPAAAEPAEVTWLRRYSSYLAPKVGLFSLDSLTLITTWSRNFLLNLVVLLSFLTCALLLPYLLIPVVRWTSVHHTAFGYASLWMGLLVLLATAYNLWHQGQQFRRDRNWLISAKGVGATVALPGVIAACFGAIWLLGGPDKTWQDAPRGVSSALGILSILLFLWFFLSGGSRPARSTHRDQHIARTDPARFRISPAAKEFFVYTVAAIGGLIACALALSGCYSLWKLWRPTGAQGIAGAMLTFGPPALLFSFSVGTTVFTGLVGRAYFERSREWWSRLNACLLTAGLVWLVWCTLAIFSLPMVRYVSQYSGDWIASLVGTGWLASLAAAIFARPPEGASQKVQWNIERILNIAAGVVIAGLLLAVASGGQWLLLEASGSYTQPETRATSKIEPLGKITHEVRSKDGSLAVTVMEPEKTIVPLPDLMEAHFSGIESIHRKEVVAGINVLHAALLILVFMLVLFAWRVDINKFSLHNMYKNRLVRCYLGASNSMSRDAQPFTGLDDDDDIPLRKLAWPAEDGTRVRRPFHILNATLNITQGSNLAWQQRKAASFTFSPLHCGYALAQTQGDTRSIEPADAEPRAYRLTEHYATRDDEEDGFRLGMALATSGAAVSPNMGYASQPARAFLLTLFNVRLGRWSSNPRSKKFRRPSPSFGLFLLLQELLGFSNEERGYVYLSDGGHFDNLGVYELVRRRCSTIFVVDAGADPQRCFSDVAETVRKCRVDLGVEIEFPDLKILAGNDQSLAEVGFIRGTIDYEPNRPGSVKGAIILLKPTMSQSRGEPADLLHYSAQNKTFPQQTTADQFFDETQFESYRRLGLFIAKECLNKHDDLLQEIEPSDARAEVESSTEAPLRATRFVNWAFGIGRPLKQLPAPENSLVDYVAGGMLAVLLIFGIFLVGDHVLLDSGGLCWGRSACEATLRSHLDGAARGTVHQVYWVARGLLDNLFVVAYVGILLCGAALAFQASERQKRSKRWMKWTFVCLVLLLVAVDYAENFALAQASARRAHHLVTAGEVSILTAIKFMLGAVCVLGFALMLPWIAESFDRRWHAKGRFGGLVSWLARLPLLVKEFRRLRQERPNAS
jgi:hypothetical protein